ncbi:MAG: DMT family transporter [Gemmatimonadetes bacterium]|nr:DMT family transporter [Gemmatimonadota bacterium]
MTPRDLVELVLLAAIWGASFLFQRVAAPEFGPVPLVATRVGIAAVILLGLLVAQGGLRGVRTHWRSLLLLGAINTAIPFTLFAFATLHVTAGIASVLNGTVPLWAGAIARFWFRERLGPNKTAGLLLGFVGVVMLVWRDGGRAGGPGVVAGLLAAFLYAIAAHLSRRRLATVDPMVVAAGSQVGALLLTVGPAVALLPATPISARAATAGILLGVFCTGVAYVLFFRLIRRIGAMRTMSVSYLIPVFGMLWGWVFLREGVTLRMGIGAALVLAGVAFATGVLQPIPESATVERRPA